MLKRTYALLAVALLSIVCSPAIAQQTLNNAAILKLHTAGLSDDLIVQTVSSSPGHYDTGVDAMIALKKAGIGDQVIGAMVAKNNGTSTVSAPPAASAVAGAPPVDEVGVYYKDKEGKWTVVFPEVVNFKTGGVLKNLASAGFVKGDLNGHIKGASSNLELTNPVTILIYVPEGTAPTEYQLLKLRQNSDNREFRSVTGGVVHVTTGATQDQVEFQFTKIAPRSYQIVLPPGTTKGQYGILPPGANASTNAASAGKIYTFHLAE